MTWHVPPSLKEDERSDLFALRVALEDEGAERRLSLLVSVTPIPALDHESHQPAVLLVGCKLTDLSELELRDGFLENVTRAEEIKQ